MSEVCAFQIAPNQVMHHHNFHSRKKEEKARLERSDTGKSTFPKLTRLHTSEAHRTFRASGKGIKDTSETSHHRRLLSSHPASLTSTIGSIISTHLDISRKKTFTILSLSCFSCSSSSHAHVLSTSAVWENTFRHTRLTFGAWDVIAKQ